MGPMQATVTPAMSRSSSPGAKIDTKWRTVEELVNVTASTAPAPRARLSSAMSSEAGRVRYAATSSTRAPSLSSSRTRRSRVSAARASRTRWPGRTRAASARASPSATYSSGTTVAGRPTDESASAVAGPMAATRQLPRAPASRPRADSRAFTISTPLTLVKTAQSYSPPRRRAASSGAQDGGGSMAIVGATSTRAPAASSSAAKLAACVLARVMTTSLPASGRAVSTDAIMPGPPGLRPGARPPRARGGPRPGPGRAPRLAQKRPACVP